MFEIWITNQLVSDNICDILNVYLQIFIQRKTNELVLVTLHGWFLAL